MVVRSGVGTGGWKTKSLAPRLTTAGHALHRWDESIGQAHSCPGLLPSLSGIHTQMVPSMHRPQDHRGALPETHQGVDGFGPILGLHNTQGALGQAVCCGGGEREEASSQHQPLPRHSVLALPAGEGERGNEICDCLLCGVCPEPAKPTPAGSAALQGNRSCSNGTVKTT